MITCICGSSALENLDLSLCASCNKERRKKPKVVKIAKFSNKNTYKTSWGERLTKVQVEKRIRQVKAQKIIQFIEKHGYAFCEKQGCGTTEGPIDCAHLVSIDKCQKEGKVELAFDIKNIQLLCRHHHQEYDKNIINYGN
jgi:hypothetical protein